MADIVRFARFPAHLLTLLLAIMIVAAPFAPVARAQEGATHVVVPGDTLSEIAAAYGTTVESLRELNGLQGNTIRIGQQLAVGRNGGRVASTGNAGTANYVVQQGDNLTAIAQRYGVQIEAILKANDIDNPRLITVGQSLVIPGAQIESSTQGAGRASASGPTYTVRAGDSLSGIAQTYGASMDAIMEANGISNARLVRIGQTLVIPGGIADYATAPDPVAAGQLPPGVAAGQKWIDVDLSEQRVVAYEGTKAVRRFTVSTGLPETPTVTGSFRIRLKMPVQDMSGGNRAAGDSYDLKGVQWVQYFHEDYAFHGTYWHTNFGRPASRGCINMTNGDARWLFDWAGPDYVVASPAWQSPTSGNPGTVVIVHN